MSQLVRLEGKHTVQTVHCALLNLCQTKKDKLCDDSPSLNVSKKTSTGTFLAIEDNYRLLSADLTSRVSIVQQRPDYQSGPSYKAEIGST